MRLAVPSPTNATAAALLWTYGQLPALSHSTKLAGFRVPGGPMERLMWLAAGYRKPGDKFRAATDTAGWRRAFPDPTGLYQELESMARVYDNEHPVDVEPVFASPIADAVPAALKGFLTLAWETLESARSTGAEPMPGIKLPGKKPVPRPTLPPPDVIPKPPLPLPRAKLSGGLVLLLLAAVAWGTRKGRR